MKAYRCKVNYDSGFTKKSATLIIFSENIQDIFEICEKILWDHIEGSIDYINIEKIDVTEKTGFVVMS